MKKIMTLALLLGTQLVGNTFAAGTAVGGGSLEEAAKTAAATAAVVSVVVESDDFEPGSVPAIPEGLFAIPTGADMHVIKETFKAYEHPKLKIALGYYDPADPSRTPPQGVYGPEPLRIKEYTRSVLVATTPQGLKFEGPIVTYREGEFDLKAAQVSSLRPYYNSKTTSFEMWVTYYIPGKEKVTGTEYNLHSHFIHALPSGFAPEIVSLDGMSDVPHSDGHVGKLFSWGRSPEGVSFKLKKVETPAS